MDHRHARAYSLVEIVMAMGVSTLVIGIAWAIFSGLMGKKDGASGVVSMTADSFLRQEGVAGIQALTRRLQESIQVIEPQPGKTSDSLVFRDVINDQITVQVKHGALIAVGPKGEEKSPVPLKGPTTVFFPVRPIRIAGCVAAHFTAVSPACVIMLLTFQDEGGKQASLLNTVNLQNPDLAR